MSKLSTTFIKELPTWLTIVILALPNFAVGPAWSLHSQCPKMAAPQFQVAIMRNTAFDPVLHCQTCALNNARLPVRSRFMTLHWYRIGIPFVFKTRHGTTSILHQPAGRAHN